MYSNLIDVEDFFIPNAPQKMEDARKYEEYIQKYQDMLKAYSKKVEDAKR